MPQNVIDSMETLNGVKIQLTSVCDQVHGKLSVHTNTLKQLLRVYIPVYDQYQ